MSIHSHAWQDSQPGNRSEESQDAVEAVKMMRSPLQGIQEEITTCVTDATEQGMSLSTVSETHPGSTAKRALQPAPHARPASQAEPILTHASGQSTGPSSSGLVQEQLVPRAGNPRSSTTPPKKQNVKLTDVSSPPKSSNGSAYEEPSQWGKLRPGEDVVETQGPMKSFLEDAEDGEDADGEDSGPTCSTPKKVITASQAPAPTASSSVLGSTPPRSPPANHPDSETTPPRSVARSVRRESTVPFSPSGRKTPGSANRKETRVHIAGGIRRKASSISVGSRKRKNSNDLDDFNTDDEESSTRREEVGKVKKVARKTRETASSERENRNAEQEEEEDVAMDLENSTMSSEGSQPMRPIQRSRLQVPAKLTTSSSTNLGTQDMSLQCGTAPSVVLSSKPSLPSAAREEEEAQEEEEQQESVPQAFGRARSEQNTPPPSPKDLEQMDELDGDDTEVVPPTSDAEAMAPGSSEPGHDLDVSAGNFSRTSIPHATPPTDPVEPTDEGDTPPKEDSFKFARIESARKNRIGRPALDTEASSTRSSASNGRGIEPRAGRELTRSRHNSTIFDLLVLQSDTQSSSTKTQPIETETLMQSRSSQARNATALTGQSGSSPSGNTTRLVPDSQYPRGAVEDRTLGSSEADALLGASGRDDQVARSREEHDDPIAMLFDDDGPRDDEEGAAASDIESELPDVSTASLAKSKKQKGDRTRGAKAPAPAKTYKRTSKRKSTEMIQSENEKSTSAPAVSKKTKKAKFAEPTPPSSENEEEEVESQVVQVVARLPDAKAASKSTDKGKGKEVKAVQQPPAGKEISLAKEAMENSRKGKTSQKPVSTASTATGASSSTKSRKSRTSSTVSDSSRSSSRNVSFSKARTPVYRDSEDDDSETAPSTSRPGTGLASRVSAKSKAAKEPTSTLPLERVYVRVDDFCYAGTISLAENGQKPFHVKFDDTTFMELHLDELVKKVYHCEVVEGDVVVRSPDADGVKPGAPRYRVLGVQDGKQERAKRAGASLQKNDPVKVQPVSSKGKEAAGNEEKWLVEATVLVVKSCDLKNRVLSTMEMQAFRELLAEDEQGIDESEDVKPAKAKAAGKMKPRSSKAVDTQINKTLFADFGLVFTTGGGAADAIADAKKYATAGGATDISDVSELFTTLDPNAESQTDTTLSFDGDSQPAGLETILLVALNPVTTPKYLKALAIGIPCVSTQWIQECAKAGKLLDWTTFTLGAGICAIAGSQVNGLQALILNQGHYDLASIAARQHRLHIFAGKKVVFLHGTSDLSIKRAEMATDLMTALGASKVLVSPAATPLPMQEAKKYDLFLSDVGKIKTGKLPKSVVPTTWDWLKECVVAGRILDI